MYSVSFSSGIDAGSFIRIYTNAPKPVCATSNTVSIQMNSAAIVTLLTIKIGTDGVVTIWNTHGQQAVSAGDIIFGQLTYIAA